MNNTLYFLRHAQTKADRFLPVSKWELSSKGIRETKVLAGKHLFDDIEVVVSSYEDKAYSTAKIIADTLQKPIIQVRGIEELDRDKAGFLKEAEFEKTLKLALTHLDDSINNWEPASRALRRFSDHVNSLNINYTGKKILIVSHGCVINLYFANLLGKLDEVYERTIKNTFLDYGIVKDNGVLRDISE